MTTPTETPTPRTQAVVDKSLALNGGDFMTEDLLEHARTLERQLTAATAQLEEAKTLAKYKDETATTFMNQVKKLQAQLEEARRDLQSVLGDAAYYPQLHICSHQRARLEGILAAMQQKEGK